MEAAYLYVSAHLVMASKAEGLDRSEGHQALCEAALAVRPLHCPVRLDAGERSVS